MNHRIVFTTIKEIFMGKIEFKFSNCDLPKQWICEMWFELHLYKYCICWLLLSKTNLFDLIKIFIYLFIYLKCLKSAHIC